MDKLFKGCRFHFSTSASMPLQRKRLLANSITQHGGVLAKSKSDATHVIGTRHLRPEYISDCLEKGKLLPQTSYSSLQKALSLSSSEPSNSETHISSVEVGDSMEYFCSQPCLLTTPNDDLIGKLDTMRQHRYLTGNHRSELTYSRAIIGIKLLGDKITPKTDVRKVPGVGPKIASLIEEYLETGQIHDAEQIKASKEYQVLNAFCDIHGVGPKTAQTWYRSRGYRCIGDLKSTDLTPLQALGLKYYGDFRQLLPRSESEQIMAIIRQHLGPHQELQATGGYRRGKPVSHDLDLLVCCPQVGLNDHHRQVVQRLRESGHILDVLSSSPQSVSPKAHRQSHVLDIVLVAFRVSPSHAVRRVDLIFCPPLQLPFGRLGWTGSRNYERNLRLFCKHQRGLHLTSTGLFDRHMRPVPNLQANDERAILTYLGLPYLAPEERNH